MSAPTNLTPTDFEGRPPPLQRLGKNINGYFGETVEIDALLGDAIAAARAHGWAIEEIPTQRESTVFALRRSPQPGAETPLIPVDHSHIYISAGIHGDEPAGPLAVRRLLQENKWPPQTELWLIPCLNPAGFRLNRRENAEGIDLNREYLQPKAAETLAHIAWLKRQPGFDLCLCLHEDWEAHGFYVYELNPDNRPSLAEPIVAKAARVCPIDLSQLIEGRPAQGGIIRPSVDPRDRPQWPESFFLLTHKTRLSYTLEAPSDFPLESRVAALTAGVEQALESFTGSGPGQRITG